jgi:DNA mismatch repair ATPase MutS
MSIYDQKVSAYHTTISQLEKDLQSISNFRLAVFLGSAIFITILANYHLGPLLFMVVPLAIVGFFALVRQHRDVEQRLRHTKFLRQVNAQEVLRMKNELFSFTPGTEYRTRDHYYVSDLDIFGSHSIFQSLNRTTMESSQELLATWLSAPASETVILERQNAVAELSPKLEWRQNFQAAGMHYKHTKSDYDNLDAWVEKPINYPNRKINYILLAILPLTLLSTWTAYYFISHVLLVSNTEEIIPYVLPLLATTAINTFILRTFKSTAADLTENITQKIKILDGYQSLAIRIETETFSCPKLLQLQSLLKRDNYSASAEISRLKRLMEVFQTRGGKRQTSNFFYSILNNLWFLDVHMIARTEKWKLENAPRLSAWTSAVNEFEALNSLAGFHHANPSFSFAEITAEPFTIDFEMLGHPLLKEEKRVSNTFKLKGRGEIAMITGSNMAGKSTFLRTLGVNIVLALMGAPCCAKAARVSIIKVFSSMRTQDNLEEGVSSFYAELKRIEHLLKLVETGEEVFFLLDEMFKGTNSKDRQKGGFSLIHQLKGLSAFGIISTHDLELAVLTEEHKVVTNLSFNSSILESEMIFDYILTPGICHDFNASELMKRSGIKIISTDL